MSRKMPQMKKIEAAEDFFYNSLYSILQEKGVKSRHQAVAYILRLSQENGANISEGTVLRWVFEGDIPKKATFERLCDWLDCYEEDLLPSNLLGILK